MSGATFSDTAGTVLSLRFGEASLGPAATAILVLALAAASVSALHLWRIGRREDRHPQIQALLGPAPDRVDSGRTRRAHWYDRLGSGVAASRIVGIAEQQRLLEALAAAGIKGQGSLARFVAGKVCGALALAVLTWMLLEWRQWFAGIAALRVALLFAALMIGWRLPDIVLSRLAARRRLRLEDGLPDALDLLVISAEAGLSLDQAVEQVARTLHASNPVVAEEFGTTASEMQVLSSRGEALENLVRRTGLASLRSITATLNQAIRFGTPLAEFDAGARGGNAHGAAGASRRACRPSAGPADDPAGAVHFAGAVHGDRHAGGIAHHGRAEKCVRKPFLNRGTRLDWACTGGRTMPFDGVKSIDQRVAARIRARRVRVGMTQQQLAERIGVAFQQAHKYERGISRVTAGRLYYIATALQAPVDYFFAAEEGARTADGDAETPLTESGNDV